MNENRTPFFSIVIVNYNHGLFLAEAIESILQQDCSDYEIIVVDGGSTDNSLDVLNRYEEYFSWWISEKDNGQSNAFNKGFGRAKGKVFFWLNADDLLLPNTLSKAKCHFLKNPSCKWLAGNTITMNENREFRWCIKGPLYLDFLIKSGTVYIYGPSSFFDRELFELANGFDESLYYTMDTDLWYRFVNLGFRFDRLNHYCWALRIHDGSKTSHAFDGNTHPKFKAERLFIQKKNNHHINKSSTYFLFIWKIITGVFLFRFLDNVKFKNFKF